MSTVYSGRDTTLELLQLLPGITYQLRIDMLHSVGQFITNSSAPSSSTTATATMTTPASTSTTTASSQNSTSHTDRIPTNVNANSDGDIQTELGSFDTPSVDTASATRILAYFTTQPLGACGNADDLDRFRLQRNVSSEARACAVHNFILPTEFGRCLAAALGLSDGQWTFVLLLSFVLVKRRRDVQSERDRRRLLLTLLN